MVPSFRTTCFSLFSLAYLARTSMVFAADCNPAEVFSYYDNLYNDVWAARSAICTQGSSGVTCGGGNCEVTSGRAYAIFEGPDEATCLQYCWVSHHRIGPPPRLFPVSFGILSVILDSDSKEHD